MTTTKKLNNDQKIMEEYFFGKFFIDHKKKIQLPN
jgi:hypothetical protein